MLRLVLLLTLLAALVSPRVAAAIDITEAPMPDPASGPVGIAPGPGGNLYVTEQQGRRIARFSTIGGFAEFPLSAADAAPVHIALGPDSNLWATDASTAGVLHRITPAGVITDFPVPTVAATGGIAAGPDGNVWYTMPASNRVGRIAPDGTALDFALPATGDHRPERLVAGPDGALWVTAPGTNSILRVDTAGNVEQFAIPSPGADPRGIALGPDGQLWFTERALGRVGRITTAGAVTEFPLGGGAPTDITAGPDGALWFTDQGGTPAMGRVTVEGQPTRYPLTAGGVPNDLTTGPDGAIYFARAPGSIGRLVVPPLPVPGRSAAAETVSGTVTVKVPGSGGFVALPEDGRALPVGSEVDTRSGRVRLTAALGVGTRVTKTSEFYDGRFRIAQARTRDAVFDVKLTGPLRGCGGALRAAAAGGKKKIKGRGLWGSGKGKFRTSGNRAAATVRGTRWLVEDRCDGSTRVRVATGVVAVRDLVRKRTVTVRAGGSYVARPRR